MVSVFVEVHRLYAEVYTLMTKILSPLLLVLALPVLGAAASPASVVETAPYSNETNAVVTASSGNIMGVSVSTSALTRVDTAINAAFSAALGANYNRAEITVQNQLSTDFYCGYSASQAIATKTNFFKISAGSVWTLKLGKGMPLYCFSDSAAAAILTIGGIAWK